MGERFFNFSAGPATLPLPVLERIRDDLPSLAGVGASVLEISHRSAHFGEILESAKDGISRLLGLPDTHKVLFVPGGARLQFSMVPMNLLRGSGKRADYILTGSWGRKAVPEAELEGDVRVCWSGEPDGYSTVPAAGEIADLGADAAYVHVTSNETIEGVQFTEVPDTGATPLVCDASSEFLSRPIAVDRYALLYAGAQKNVGPAGVTIVIVREDLLERVPAGLHTMLDYRNWVKHDSLINTPPAFAIYVVNLVTRWLIEEIGGLAAMQKRNEAKAARLYELIDSSDGYYRGHARADARSKMNVTFRLADADLEARFLEEAAARGLSGLKGHRSVGGIRASIYNAMPPEGVAALCDFMTEFRA